MTFGELYRQVAKELGYPAPLVKEILVAGFRVGIEEIMSNKEKAKLEFDGLFSLSVGQKRFVSHPQWGGAGDATKMVTKWVFRFAPSRILKAILNDEEDIHELAIGGKILLYPKEHEAKHGKMDMGRATNIYTEYVPIKYKVIDENEEKRKELKKRMALEQVNNILEED